MHPIVRPTLVAALAIIWAWLLVAVLLAWTAAPDGRHIALVIATGVLAVVLDRKGIAA